MKTSVARLDADSLDWTATPTPGIFEKVLNLDPTTGARTLLLKSLPRPKDILTDRRPQFHPVDEEFYCLSGKFTLEGDAWFRRHSYVYYPSRLVHGHDVDVPGGYEIYLRNSGSIATTRVDRPQSRTLYFADGIERPASEITLVTAEEKLRALQGRAPLSLVLLRAADKDACAFVLNLAQDARLHLDVQGHEDFLELFVLAGCVATSSQSRLPARHYSFAPRTNSFELTGIQPLSSILINCASRLTLDQFIQRASAVTYADAIKPC